MFTILLVLGKNMHNVEKLIKKVRSFAHPSLTRKEGFHENSGSQEQVIFFPLTCSNDFRITQVETAKTLTLVHFIHSCEWINCVLNI